MTTDVSEYATQAGTVVTRSTCAAAPDATAKLLSALDTRRGLLLASSFEYPGRYKRYDLGFVDPPLVLECRARTFQLTATTQRGLPLLAACDAALRPLACVTDYKRSETQLTGHVQPSAAAFAEEDRTRSPSVFSVVRALIAAFAAPEDQVLGLYGAFGYDLVFQFEALRLKQMRAETQRDLVLYLPDRVLVVDHERGTALEHAYEFSFAGKTSRGLPRLHVSAPVGTRPAAPPTRDHAPGEFARLVEEARTQFAAGELFEVTPSQVQQQPCAAAPSAVFHALRASNPAPYGFCINLGADEVLVGASPEMYVRVKAGRVETCPIAGTIARGRDALADADQILTLLNSEKDSAELTMCTDVDRNDKARICEPGSVRVIGRRQIELYSRLIHTVDHVEGQLRPEYDALDALLTHMWAVTVTGAPKLAAMQFIEDHERSPRGYYGGAVGALHFDGSLNTGLTLRTMQITAGVARVRAGATLHFDSDPQTEDEECALKASALLHVLAQTGRPAEPVQPRAARRSPPLRVLLIDHQDSFVHTLADYFRQAGCAVTTLRHGFARARYRELDPQLVVLSPGPSRPDAFAMRDTLAELAELGLPVFGVCLGLQGMVEFCGGQLGQLPVPMHGKSSDIRCTPSALFAGLPEQLRVGRYHSLFALPEVLPAELDVLASTTDDRTIMAIAHRSRPWTAVQFHPESILSKHGDYGLRLIQNVVSAAAP